ncbi:MAG: DUF2723 domain-containing protein [Phycisphaerales bacterium]|nr:MAG: DUF2723 domain-containing protein [Phycisphaerales bacterium]
MNITSPHSRSAAGLRPAAAAWLCAFAAALLLYGLTMAPGLLWQDSADVQIAVALDDWRGPYDLARTHVVHLALASAIRHAFDANPAWAANFVSVLAGALTVANLVAVLVLILRRSAAVLAAGTALALSHTLWQFSTAAEVNCMVAAFLSAELLILAIFDRVRRGWLLWMVGLVNGLGAANHNLALLTLTCYVALALLSIRKWLRPYGRDVLIAAVLWLVGYIPMLVLVIMELRLGLALRQVVASALVGSYADAVFNVRVTPTDAIKIVGLLGLNFPTPLIFAAVVGWPGLGHRCGHHYRIVLALLFVTHFLFAARYNVPDQYSFMIPAYWLLGVFLGAGIDVLLERSPAGRRLALSVLVLALAVPAPIVYAVLPSLARRLPASVIPVSTRPVPYRDPYKWFLQPWRPGYDGPERFAREALAVLPPDAFVLTDTTLRGPILFLQNHEGLRHDVRVGEALLQPFHDRWQPNPDAFRQLVREGRLFSLVGDGKYLCANRWIGDEFRFRPVGPIYQVVPPRQTDEQGV